MFFTLKPSLGQVREPHGRGGMISMNGDMFLSFRFFFHNKGMVFFRICLVAPATAQFAF